MAGRASYSLGYVDGVAFAVIAPILMVFAPLGAKAAAKSSDTLLKWIYVALLAFISVYMAFETF